MSLKQNTRSEYLKREKRYPTREDHVVSQPFFSGTPLQGHIKIPILFHEFLKFSINLLYTKIYIYLIYISLK